MPDDVACRVINTYNVQYLVVGPYVLHSLESGVVTLSKYTYSEYTILKDMGLRSETST